MGKFTEESDLIFTAGRTATRGNWVSVEWCGFEIKLSETDEKSFSQSELKGMCLKCLNKLFG